jgi:uncharacterized protein YyaL (SSP411 family)
MSANRLAGEKSPYLLQHAHNPVDWYPWGDEAFAKARTEDKPIFLSIGYSTCHWCHVMERESFENPEIAAILNERFVPVKVDREERPDVDGQYMTAVQGLAGSGGWPLTVVLTPELKPFFGGTYFPPVERLGRPGLRTILLQLHAAWSTSREQVEFSAQTVAEFVRSRVTANPAKLGPRTLHQGWQMLRNDYDEANGGFGGAPKFPRPHALSFLLRLNDRVHGTEPLRLVEHQLDAMAAGGIHDHLGGGFARYSTDARWLVPHFEKMLYDQALLARAYLEAYQVTRRERHADVARDIFAYVLRDLRGSEGAFLSAEDADSEGEEGKFYVWLPDEVRGILGAETYPLFAAAYGVTLRGNFEGGRTVLSRVIDDASLAAQFGVEEAEVRARLAEARRTLFAARETRVRPHRDDKVLADWNGLMISALALGARVLGDEEYLRAAESAADFVLGTMADQRGLLHRYRDGSSDIPAFLDDYAFVAAGLFDLYEASLDPARLDTACHLARDLVRLFEDGANGGFHFTAAHHETLMTRDKQLYDGAAPSGNSVAIGLLLKLGALTGDATFTRAGERALESFGGTIDAYPTAYTEALCALDFALGPTAEVVVAGRVGDTTASAMLRLLQTRHLPRTVFARRREDPDPLVALLPYTAAMEAPAEGAAAHVCRDRSCERPVSRVEDLAAATQVPGAPLR